MNLNRKQNYQAAYRPPGSICKDSTIIPLTTVSVDRLPTMPDARYQFDPG